jgi:hypothetical protein
MKYNKEEKKPEEEKVFKIMNSNIKVDLVPYVKELMKKNPALKVFIGSDSQNSGRNTTYATVLVFHNNHGGHVIYNKEIVPIVRDRFTRLWMEVERSISIANKLRDSGVENIDCIDLDYNPNPKFFSNKLLDPAVGYVRASGYTPRWKPMSVYASIVADKICK